MLGAAIREEGPFLRNPELAHSKLIPVCNVFMKCREKGFEHLELKLPRNLSEQLAEKIGFVVTQKGFRFALRLSKTL